MGSLIFTGQGSGSGSGPANSILLVSILNATVPVTLDNIFQVFKPYGDVFKIVIFTKNDVLKALVQMGTIDSAVNAKMLLEGKDMFQVLCWFDDNFSRARFPLAFRIAVIFALPSPLSPKSTSPKMAPDQGISLSQEANSRTAASTINSATMASLAKVHSMALGPS